MSKKNVFDAAVKEKSFTVRYGTMPIQNNVYERLSHHAQFVFRTWEDIDHSKCIIAIIVTLIYSILK